MTLSPEPCGSIGNSQDGCTLVFPRHDSSVSPLCHKCRRLNSATSEADQDTIKAWNQCSQCGVSGSRVVDPCGECRRLDVLESGQVDSAYEATRRERAALMAEQMGGRRAATSAATSTQGLPPPSQPPSQFQIRSTLTQTTLAGATLSRAPPLRPEDLPSRSSAAPPVLFAPTVLVVFLPKTQGIKAGTGANFAKKVGMHDFTIAQTSTMEAVLTRCVTIINETWNLSNVHSLTQADCLLRMPGNVALHASDMTRTVQAFLQIIASERPDQWTPPPGAAYKKRVRLSFLFMEVLVCYDTFNERVLELGAGSNARKRKPVSSDEDDEGVLRTRSHKRGRSSGQVLESRFVLDRPATVSTRSDEIEVTFKAYKFAINADTGKAVLQNDEGYDIAFLSKAPVELAPDDEGTMKKLYKLFWEDKTWAAKKVVNLGPEVAKLSHFDRAEVFDKETEAAVRMLAQLKHFRGQFFAHVAEQRLTSSVSKFDVSKGFGIKTAVATHGPGSHYLIEPLRPSSTTRKFSGTMAHIEHLGKDGATIAAFTHWAMAEAGAQICFADLQGTLMPLGDDQSQWILFDPTTHTIYGHSCAGDHGPDGLEAFIKGHRCSSICTLLGLQMADLKITFKKRMEDLENETSDLFDDIFGESDEEDEHGSMGGGDAGSEKISVPGDEDEPRSDEDAA